MIRHLLLLLGALLPAVEPVVDSGARRGAWPFAAPPADELRQQEGLVFAHYFPPFPRSFEDAAAEDDYYAVNYLRPGGEGGKFRQSGGFLRDRPLPRASGAPSWRAVDARWEVDRAAELGIDGFLVDLLSTSGDNYERAVNVIRAAAAHGHGFGVVLMPDMDGEFGEHPERLPATIVRLAAEAGLYRLPDGRLLLSAFNAQRQPPAWWRVQLDLLREAGVPCAFLPCVQEVERHQAGFLALPAAVGLGDWGVRSVIELAVRGDHARTAHAAGRWWMEPVSPQDYRPKERLVREAAGTAAYRAMWERAIRTRADVVQIVSWNDFSESTHIAPGSASGWTWYDLTAYYVAWFKTGAPPPVTADAVHLVHRIMRADAGPAARRSAATPAGTALDLVEAVVFAKHPGEVVLSVGTQQRRQVVPAGLSTVTVPMEEGRPASWLLRGGTVVRRVDSRSVIVSDATEQDLTYRGSGDGAP